MTFPTFIDNQCSNTLKRAIIRIIGGEGRTSPQNSKKNINVISIATAYFSFSGYKQLMDSITDKYTLRILLGAEVLEIDEYKRRTLGESSDEYLNRRIQNRLKQMDMAIKYQRDHMPFSKDVEASMRVMLERLRSGKLVVKRFESEFLHAKAYLFTNTASRFDISKGDVVVAGSSNLTVAGLVKNMELNLGSCDESVVKKSKIWFNELWDGAEHYDLETLLEDALKYRTPWEIFIGVLWRLYGEELLQVENDYQNLPLTMYQRHGVARAMRMIKRNGGVIVADEVGLGKTYIAGEVIKSYNEKRQRVVVLCPASLRDTTWKQFQVNHNLHMECLSFEQLANEVQICTHEGKCSCSRHLQRSIDEYQLVVVDEAHNYRNPTTTARAKVLKELLKGPSKDLLMLTATPVNNSLWDLYYLLRYYMKQDTKLAEYGIRSVRERFLQAMRSDPTSVNPDILYPVIDATTVKRTRQFIRDNYPGDMVMDDDNVLVPISFPEPVAITVRYGVEKLESKLYDLIERALSPQSVHAIRFARYRPNDYSIDNDEVELGQRAEAMVGLLRSGLLKRFESSVFAFRNTVLVMIREHQRFLKALANGYVVTTRYLKEVSTDDDDVFDEFLNSNEYRVEAAAYDVKSLAGAVTSDLEKLMNLHNQALQIQQNNDQKLVALLNELIRILRQAKDEALTLNEGQLRKVMIFTSYSDTAEWIYQHLIDKIESEPKLLPYSGRIVAICGSRDISGVSREEAMIGFAPKSMKGLKNNIDDKYDVLISTDILAEGVNLQQCRNIVNFDLPWNPMRLVQRHGRIDRIKSEHSRVYLRTVFPEDRLDKMLLLEEKIQNKLAMAASSVGVDAPIEGSARGKQVFADTRDEIERLYAEDSTLFKRGGFKNATQTGEEYRQKLRVELERNSEQVKQMPWRVGSGQYIKGAPRGIMFCAAVHDRTFLRYVLADQNWRSLSLSDGIWREIGAILRLIECVQNTETRFSIKLQEGAFELWRIAQKDIHDEWMFKTDPINMHPKVNPINHQVAKFIRDNQQVDMHKETIEDALNIVESPWPRNEEVNLREWFVSDEYSGSEKVKYLIEKIIQSDVEPAETIEPLPVIALEEVELYCWMGIESD